jgi:DNA-binding PadR family transcriptional regulator
MKETHSKIRYVILGILYENSMTGYEIKNYMEYSTANFINASFGNIYPTLNSLMVDKMVSMSEIVDDSRFKKIYSITEQGKNDFSEWLRKPFAFTIFNFEHLSRLFFYQYLDKEERMRMMEELKKNVQKEYDKLLETENKVKGEIGHYQLITLQFGKDYYQMIIDWYEILILKERNWEE